jgi:hypothetical protein
MEMRGNATPASDSVGLTPVDIIDCMEGSFDWAFSGPNGTELMSDLKDALLRWLGLEGRLPQAAVPVSINQLAGPSSTRAVSFNAAHASRRPA